MVVARDGPVRSADDAPAFIVGGLAPIPDSRAHTRARAQRSVADAGGIAAVEVAREQLAGAAAVPGLADAIASVVVTGSQAVALGSAAAWDVQSLAASAGSDGNTVAHPRQIVARAARRCTASQGAGGVEAVRRQISVLAHADAVVVIAQPTIVARNGDVERGTEDVAGTGEVGGLAPDAYPRWAARTVSGGLIAHAQWVGAVDGAGAQVAVWKEKANTTDTLAREIVACALIGAGHGGVADDDVAAARDAHRLASRPRAYGRAITNARDVVARAASRRRAVEGAGGVLAIAGLQVVAGAHTRAGVSVARASVVAGNRADARDVHHPATRNIWRLAPATDAIGHAGADAGEVVAGAIWRRTAVRAGGVLAQGREVAVQTRTLPLRDVAVAMVVARHCFVRHRAVDQSAAGEVCSLTRHTRMARTTGTHTGFEYTHTKLATIINKKK